MKIEKLKLRNFAKFNNFECHFNERITRLTGVNGSGKTTVGLYAIMAALKGVGERGDMLPGSRFRIIGNNSPSSDVELTLIDEEKDNTEIKVKNHITKSGNQITFDAPAGYPINEEWLNNLLNVAFISAKHFTSFNSKDQALLLGIDTSKFDQKMKELKEGYRILNSEYRQIGELEKVEKVEPINLANLTREMDEAYDKFRMVEGLRNEKEKTDDAIEETIEEIARLEDKLNALREHQKEIEKKQKELGPAPDIEKIRKAMHNAEETNNKAAAYKNYLSKLERKNGLLEKIKENKQKQKEVEREKVSYVQKSDFGFSGLTVDDDGNLLLNERPIREPYFSKGELEIVVAKLYASINPSLKVRFIDDFELLDEENQKRLLDSLLDKGFQIITAEVSTTKKGNNRIYLKECKIVNGYDEKEKDNLLL